MADEAGNASRHQIMVVATARSPEWPVRGGRRDESGSNISCVMRTNFVGTVKIFREPSARLFVFIMDLENLNKSFEYRKFYKLAFVFSVLLLS